MIVLSVWRRIVLDADESPTMVREHGNAETARQSIKTVPDGQSASPVTWRMSSSYTRVSHAVEKPDAGQAITRDVTYTNRSAEGSEQKDPHDMVPPNRKRLLPTAAMAWLCRALGGEPETRAASSCSHSNAVVENR